MKPTNTVKKRSLKDIDFSKEDSHIALVGPAVGGPANGQSYALVMKAVNFSDEALEKMQAIKVTMSVPDFLRKFFNLYYEDAEVLARMMGYVPEEKDEAEEYSYEDYIEERLAGFEILKSLYESQDIEKMLAELNEQQYLGLLTDQEKIETVLKGYDKKSKTEAPSKKKARVKDASTASEEKKEAPASGNQPIVKETKAMPQAQTTLEAEVTVEMVQKSDFEAVQKALADVQAVLKAAQEEAAVLRAEKAEAIRKARFDKLKTAVKDEDKAETLFKALSLLETADEFDACVEVLSKMQTAVEKSAMFEEKGAAAESSVPAQDESPVVKALRAQGLIAAK